jgi:RNA polymerase sigma-70 factor (ECF subfamily)
MPSDDEELARRAQQGCLASFEELVRRFQVPLLQFLRQRAGTLADAEDLTQETFVRAYQKLHFYQARLPFSTWLFTIAHRLSVNQRRRRRPTADSAALESVAAAAPLPEEVVAEEEECRRLWDAAAEVLTPQQFTALWLHYVEQLPVEQIAQVIGRSRAAAKTILFRARRKLLPLVAEEQPRGAAGESSAAINKSTYPKALATTHVSADLA